MMRETPTNTTFKKYYLVNNVDINKTEVKKKKSNCSQIITEIEFKFMTFLTEDNKFILH